jgi:hypothetical protein
LLDEVKPPPPFFLFVKEGFWAKGGMDSGDCAVKDRNSSSVVYQKSVLAFAGSRHEVIYVGFIDDNL